MNNDDLRELQENLAEVQHRLESSLSTAERVFRSAGTLLVLTGAVSILLGLLTIARPTGAAALTLVFLGGGVLFGLVGLFFLLPASRRRPPDRRDPGRLTP